MTIEEAQRRWFRCRNGCNRRFSTWEKRTQHAIDVHGVVTVRRAKKDKDIPYQKDKPCRAGCGIKFESEKYRMDHERDFHGRLTLADWMEAK